MKTVTEHIRFSLHAQRGLVEPDTTLKPEKEWSAQFIEFMRNRMVMGTYRYGPVRTSTAPPRVRLQSMRRRLKRYEETGDLETLVDVANLCLCEFIASRHPLKHWEPVDDGIHTEY